MPKPTPPQITRIAKLLRLAMDKGAAEPEAIAALMRLRSYLDAEGLAYGDIFTEPRQKQPKPVRRPYPGNMHVHVYTGPFGGTSTSTGGYWHTGA